MKILIGTPSARGLFTAGFVGSLVDMVSALRHQGHTVHHAIVTQALVSKSRDALAGMTLHGGYEYLWMIDDDMQWGDDAFESFWKLMLHSTPIIAVAAPVRTYPTQFPARFVPDSERVLHGVKVRDAVTVGTGFMAVHRGVFEKLRDYKGSATAADAPPLLLPYRVFLPGQQKSETWRFFEERMITGDTADGTRARVLLGEDESFVAMAREWGKFSTIVPVDVEIGHEGMHMFKGRVSDHWDKVFAK
jgi:hypothetical protein